MRWFGSLSIAKKLILAISIIGTMGAALFLTGVMAVQSVRESNSALYDHSARVLDQVTNLSTAYQQVLVALSDSARADAEQLQQRIETRKAYCDLVMQSLSSLESSTDSAQVKELISQFRTNEDEFLLRVDQFEKALNAGKRREATQLLDEGELKGYSEKQVDLITRISTSVTESAAALNQKTKASTSWTFRVMTAFAMLGTLLAVFFAWIVVRAIAGTLGKLRQAAEKLSVGDPDVNITIASRDELGDLAESFQRVANMLRDRAATSHKIATGDLSCVVKVHSDADVLGRSLTGLVETLRRVLDELSTVTLAARSGQLHVRGDANAFQGGYQDIVNGVNATVDAIVTPLQVAAAKIAEIADGHVPESISGEYAGDFAEIQRNLNQSIATMTMRAQDQEALIAAVLDGHLTTRIDVARYTGANGDVAAGMNAMLDALTSPITVAAQYLDSIAHGDIPEKITADYKGDFNQLKDSLNHLIATLMAFVDAQRELHEQHNAGMIDRVLPADRFEGVYRAMADGMNKLVRSHTDLNMRIVDIVKQYAAGDLSIDIERLPGLKGQITAAVDEVKRSMQALHAEIMMLVEAARQGRLSVRGDADKFRYAYRDMVAGLNSILDGIVGPIQIVERVLGQLAKGDLTSEIRTDHAGDFNRLKKAVNTTGQQVRAVIKQIGDNTALLATSSVQLGKVSEEMSASADRTSCLAQGASAASEQVSGDIQTVATGADEMGASIKEIAKNTAEASKIANQAVQLARTTNDTIIKLGESSSEVGQVITVITTIARQTNLLALNAAIEAARAGDAGRGFSVVANEVKELAFQTAKATEDISRKIQTIQGDTQGAVDAIGHITQVIEQISDIQNTIATAVEQQSATTSEISRTLANAARGGQSITTNISGVADAARKTTEAAGQTEQSALSLASMARDLSDLIGQFRCDEAAKLEPAAYA